MFAVKKKMKNTYAYTYKMVVLVWSASTNMQSVSKVKQDGGTSAEKKQLILQTACTDIVGLICVQTLFSRDKQTTF